MLASSLWAIPLAFKHFYYSLWWVPLYIIIKEKCHCITKTGIIVWKILSKYMQICTHLNWQLVSTQEIHYARRSTWNSWSEHKDNFQNVISYHHIMGHLCCWLNSTCDPQKISSRERNSIFQLAFMTRYSLASVMSTSKWERVGSRKKAN